jgi:hypothetical protein
MRKTRTSPVLHKSPAPTFAKRREGGPLAGIGLSGAVTILPRSRNTKGGLKAALELSLSRALRFAPYKRSLSLHAINVKKYQMAARDFREGPGEIRTHDL